MTAAAQTPQADRPAMTHRQVLEAMSGLLLGLFVAILSSTVVSAALPRIITDLGGGQSSYTWVVTATLLALTVSTPIWGKLADLFDRKLPRPESRWSSTSVGSILAGASQSTGMADRLPRAAGRRRRRHDRAHPGGPLATSSPRASAAATWATSAP